MKKGMEKFSVLNLQKINSCELKLSLNQKFNGKKTKPNNKK
jgi:hypothetical protein